MSCMPSSSLAHAQACATIRTTALTPIFGACVHGLNLQDPQPDEVVTKLRDLLLEHRLLLFKQGPARLLSGERQVEISKWFGQLDSTFYRHPRSPHPDVFRVSNDEAEGCTRVGRSGWHIDGSFQATPFKVQTMHFLSVVDGGATLFSPLTEVIDALPAQTRAEWEQLSFVGSGDRVHPLIYAHPQSGASVLCFHCGEPFVRSFAVNFDAEAHTAQRLYDARQTSDMRMAIARALEAQAHTLEWEAGDFALLDNLALARAATAPRTGSSRHKMPGDLCCSSRFSSRLHLVVPQTTRRRARSSGERSLGCACCIGPPWPARPHRRSEQIFKDTVSSPTKKHATATQDRNAEARAISFLFISWHGYWRRALRFSGRHMSGLALGAGRSGRFGASPGASLWSALPRRLLELRRMHATRYSTTY